MPSFWCSGLDPVTGESAKTCFNPHDAVFIWFWSKVPHSHSSNTCGRFEEAFEGQHSSCYIYMWIMFPVKSHSLLYLCVTVVSITRVWNYKNIHPHTDTLSHSVCYDEATTFNTNIRHSNFRLRLYQEMSLYQLILYPDSYFFYKHLKLGVSNLF